MLGQKIYKKPFDYEEYNKCADWCNSVGTATIEDKGEYYECVAIPAPSFDELKSQKLSQVDTWTANKITGGFISSASGEPVRYDSDKDTQITMQGIALNVNSDLFTEKYPNGCPVRGYAENSDIKSIFMLNAEQVLQWCADLSIHIGTCKQEGWAKQAEVNACTTIEELEAIVLSENKEVIENTSDKENNAESVEIIEENNNTSNDENTDIENTNNGEV